MAHTVREFLAHRGTTIVANEIGMINSGTSRVSNGHERMSLKLLARMLARYGDEIDAAASVREAMPDEFEAVHQLVEDQRREAERTLAELSGIAEETAARAAGRG